MKDVKTMSDVVGIFLKYLHSTGLYSPERFSLKGKITYLIVIYMVLETLFVIAYSWQQLDFYSRMTALENLNLAIGILNIATEHQLLYDRKECQLQLMLSQLYLYDVTTDKLKVSLFDEKKAFVKSMESKSIFLTKIIVTTLRWYFIGYSLSALFGLVVYLTHSNFNRLSLPIVFYNPFSRSPSVPFDDFRQYLTILLFELWYINLSSNLVLTMGGFYFLSIDNVIREMKLFQMNLHELSLNFDAIEAESANVQNSAGKYEILRPTSKRVFVHHQRIFRKVGILNKGLDYIVMYYNPFICVQLCLAIFCILKVDLLLKIKYGFAFITVIIMSFIYCERGQKLEDEGEKLRASLYSFSWMGKPTWFCRSLLILITQSNRIPKIETFRILTLNRKNLKGILQAVYSYFNLLTRFSR